MSVPVQVSSSDLHVLEFESLPAPEQLLADLPAAPAVEDTVVRGRDGVSAILRGTDQRLLVIAGPCSVHDPAAALDYAARLSRLAEQYSDDLLIIMRSYFEKPRTTVGWKGLIYDPHLDGSHDISAGLVAARRFLLEVTQLGLPAATEMLEPILPQYLADLISWAAIGARTTESQVHRQLASGLSMPVGFKNGTDGDVQVAIDACIASGTPQAFVGVDRAGRAALVRTTGNPDAHVVLRGGRSGPNYGSGPVASASELAAGAGVNPRIVVDASHGNSGKSHLRQAEVVEELAAQVADGRSPIAGVMMESFLVGGAQSLDVASAEDLVYGQSVTDACLSWETTVDALGTLAAASRRRRAA
jgi:3-deoxy-7-phosphoheptulonate synthase